MKVEYFKPKNIDSFVRDGFENPELLVDKSWSDKQKQEFVQTFNELLPETKKRLNEEYKTRAYLQKEGQFHAEGIPFVRDIPNMAQNVGESVASVFTRPFDGEQADEFNRNIDKRNKIAAIADTHDAIPDILQGGFRSAGESIAKAGLLAATTGGYGVIPGFALDAGNKAITEAKDAGLKGDDIYNYAARSAIIEGGITALFSSTGAGGFEKLFGKGRAFRGGVKNFLKGTGKATLQELPEEYLIELSNVGNQLYSDVRKNKFTSEEAGDIFKEVLVTTLMSVGGATSLSRLKQRNSIKLHKEITNNLMKSQGWTFQQAEAAVSRASESEGDFQTNLGKEIIEEGKFSTDGVAYFMMNNPEKAKELSEKKHLSNKDMEKIGFPKRNRKVRGEFHQTLKKLQEAVDNELNETEVNSSTENDVADPASEPQKTEIVTPVPETQAHQTSDSDLDVTEVETPESNTAVTDAEVPVLHAIDMENLAKESSSPTEFYEKIRDYEYQFDNAKYFDLANDGRVDRAIVEFWKDKSGNYNAKSKSSGDIESMPATPSVDYNAMSNQEVFNIAKSRGLKVMGKNIRMVKKQLETLDAENFEQPSSPDALPQIVDYDSMNRKELIKMAKEQGMKYPSHFETSELKVRLKKMGVGNANAQSLPVKERAGTWKESSTPTNVSKDSDQLRVPQPAPQVKPSPKGSQPNKSKVNKKADEVNNSSNQKDKRVPTGNAMGAFAGDSFTNDKQPKSIKKEKIDRIKEDTKRNMEKSSVQKSFDGLTSIIAPGNLATRGSNILRESNSKAAQRNEYVKHTLNQYDKLFRNMDNKSIIDFIDKMETGKKQTSRELQEVANTMRSLLDDTRKRVQKHGKLKDYYENYFPHLFKKPEQAQSAIREIMNSGSFLGSQGWNKKRKYLTLKDGLNAGLELAFDNPVDMVFMRIYDMNKYLAGADAMKQLKSEGFAVYVPESLENSYLPSGYSFVDDPAFKVISSVEFTTPEAYDKLVVDQLLAVAKRLGVTHKRLAKMRGQRWGESSKNGKYIATRFGGPVSVIAHELGHQIGDIYGLHDLMLSGELGGDVKAIRKEWRALADLRMEKQEASENFKKYVRKKAEKEAVMLEAWLASPEKMAKVAPTLTKAWRKFLQSNSKLTPLLNLDRSLVLGSSSQTFKQDGIHLRGKWALPAEITNLIDNQLKPGLRNSKNHFVRTLYQKIRFMGNAMNQSSLALSGFHALNVSSDAISSNLGIGLQKVFRGDFKGAWSSAKGAPMAWLTDLKEGRKIINLMRTTDMDKMDHLTPETQLLLKTIVKSGGRASMDAMYHNQAIKSMRESVRAIKTEGVGVKSAKIIPQSIFAALELTAMPIMEYQVPALKMGVTKKMFADIFEQAQKKGWSQNKIQEEASRAWDSVENRMGQLTYDNLHWNKVLKDSLMLSLRSVGWNLGSLREFPGAVVDTFKIPKRLKNKEDIMTRKMGYALASSINYAVQASVIMFLYSGKWPWEDEEAETIAEYAKNFYFPKTGKLTADGSPERLNLPHYSKDNVSWFVDPVKTIKHKLHPIWALAGDLYENEDYFGTEIRNPEDGVVGQLVDTVKHISESFLPFSVRNYFQLRDSGEGIVKSSMTALSGVGVAPGYITKTRSRQMMDSIIAERMPQMTRSQAAFDKSAKRKEAVKALRAGQKDIDLSMFTERQKSSIKDEAALTPYQAKFKRLSAEDAVNVFAIANTKERKDAWDILTDKMSRVDVSQDAKNMYYELQLNQAQIDDRIKADVVQLRTLAYSLTNSDISKGRVKELIEQIKSNPQFKGDHKQIIAAFRHRWLWSKSGKPTRRVIKKAYWKRVRKIYKAFHNM